MIAAGALATLALAMIGDEEYDPDLLDLLGERCHPEGVSHVFLGANGKTEARVQAILDYQNCVGKLARIEHIRGTNSHGRPAHRHFPQGIEVTIMKTGSTLIIRDDRQFKGFLDSKWWVKPTKEALESHLGLTTLHGFWTTPRSYGWVT